MADGRMLKKKISVSEQVADLTSDLHRLLFTWCIPHLDVEGRMCCSPRKFKGMVCPLLDHVAPKNVSEFLADAGRVGLVSVYVVGNEQYMHVPGFDRNQTVRKDREAESTIPSPSQATPGVVREWSGSGPGELRVKLREEKLSEVKSNQVNVSEVNCDGQIADHDDEQNPITISGEESPDTVPHKTIIGLWHSIMPGLQQVRAWGPKSKAALRSRWREDKTRQSVEWWESFFKWICESDFLMGKTPKPFSLTLSWVVLPSNFEKILNGQYHPKAAKDGWDAIIAKAEAEAAGNLDKGAIEING